MNKQTLDERFEDYNEPTEQEEICLMKSLVKKNCRKKECHYDILNKASSI